MFPTGMYAVRDRESDLGYAFFMRDCQLAMLRAGMTGERVVYFTVDQYQLHMEQYYNTGIRYEGE